MDAMSCLPPPPASFLQSSPFPAYYTDAAIARALHYSTSTDHYSYSPAASSSSPSPSSSLLADFPCAGGAGGSNWFSSAAPAPAPAPPTGLTCDSVLVASDAAPRPPSTPVVTSVGTATTATNKRRLGLGPAATGRAGKRRPRASKRAPTTYISTDPSNFRLMVQHVTGVHPEPAAGDDLLMPASFDASAASMLLDCPTTFGGAAFGDAALQLPSGDDAAEAFHHHRLQQQQEQQQQPCYPTLDSWSVMYENSDLLL